MESKYIKDGHVTDWAAYMDEEDAYEAQNSQNQSQGSEDHTLIGNQESKTYNDSTGFLTSGKVITSDYDRAPEDTTLLSSLHPMVESEHTIRKILTRPVKIATVTFLTSQTAGTQIYPAGVDVLNTLRTAPGFRLAREKISGFYGIHMTAVLKVTLNPQPFESGMFQIYFVPMVNTYTPVVSPTQTPPELILPFSTGCPNVLCNIGIQSEVELAVPYTGPSPFINMTNMNSDFGTFYIQSLVPINDSTNNASCEMSIYLYFQNVQLFGASPRTWTLQGDLPSEKQEADSKTSGNPLKSSGPLSQLSSSIRSTVNDVADDVQPILDMLGLSAPDANPNPQRFHQDPYASFATVDTTKTPLKTSYTFSHHLDIGQLGIDKNDEMDLVYIAQKPCYYNQFTWNTTQDAGTQLYSYKVEPNCILHQSQETTTLVAPTRLRYISNCFRYWRGTIQFTFHVVANKFHSGRLRFVLSLGGELPSNRLSELYPYAFSQIVDLRDSTTFVVQVPYFASTPYRIMPQTYDDASSSYIVNGGVSSLEDEVPRLQVFIENELRAPDTTSNSIQIVCMQSAGMDFEFATPVVSTSYPYLPTPATLQGDCAMVINMVSQKYRKQMDSLSKDHFKYTVGERISSVRQLIKRPQLVGAGTIDYADAQFRDFLLYPFCFYVPSDSTGLTGDTLQYFRYLYRFFRGSLRFLVTTRDPQTQFTLRYDADGMNLSNNITTQLGSFGTRTPILSVTDYASGNLTSLPLSATIPFFSPLQGGMEFEIPYYSRFHKLGTSFTRDLTTYEADITSGREPAGLAFLQIYSDNEKPNTYVHFFRHASDDFTLGYLLGAPLCSYGGVPSS